MIAKIMQVNPSLNYLNLQKADLIHPEGEGACSGALMQSARMLADALRVNTSLTALNLSSNYIGFEAALTLVDADALFDALRTNTSLIKLNLFSNSIGPKGGVALADALRINASLMSLDLQDNELDPEGGVVLADALRINASLTEVRSASLLH